MSRSPVAVLYDKDGNAVEVRLENDGGYALRVTGNTTPSPPVVPPAATEVLVFGDTPLSFGSISNPQTDSFTIPNGETFTALRFIVGGEGDSTESGSRVDLVYVDASSVDHLVARQYVQGFTVETNLATSRARDGTSMTGDGTNTKIEIRRYRLSGGSLELDALLVGYY